MTVAANKLLVTALYLGWFIPGAAMAQAVDGPLPTSSFNHQASILVQPKDVVVVGTVQKLVSRYTPGSSFGTQLLLKNEHGTSRVNLGPYLPADFQESLNNGQRVQVVGTSQSVNGQNYLLARLVVVAGRQVVVRNERGFLVRPRPETASHHQGQSELTGGNR